MAEKAALEILSFIPALIPLSTWQVASWIRSHLLCTMDIAIAVGQAQTHVARFVIYMACSHVVQTPSDLQPCFNVFPFRPSSSIGDWWNGLGFLDGPKHEEETKARSKARPWRPLGACSRSMAGACGRAGGA